MPTYDEELKAPAAPAPKLDPKDKAARLDEIQEEMHKLVAEREKILNE